MNASNSVDIVSFQEALLWKGSCHLQFRNSVVVFEFVCGMARKSARCGKGKWRCGTCALQCNDNAVFCEGCNLWQHAICEGLSKKQLSVLNTLTEEYLCSRCTHVRGGYNFTTALERLSKACMAGTLESAIKMEIIFMRVQPAKMCASVKDVLLGNRTPDLVAQELLQTTGNYSS